MGKNKIFQDSTHGYISVDEQYVSNIIDSFEMQRIKDVCQTGIRPIFSGATHDRFSHSMGVYHLGCSIYDAFKKSVYEHFQNTKDLSVIVDNLAHWEKMYKIACLLHDIGHPAFSHTLEYLYNSPYICINTNTDKIQIDYKELNRLFIRSKWSENSQTTYLQYQLVNKIKTAEKKC